MTSRAIDADFLAFSFGTGGRKSGVTRRAYDNTTLANQQSKNIHSRCTGLDNDTFLFLLFPVVVQRLLDTVTNVQRLDL